MRKQYNNTKTYFQNGNVDGDGEPKNPPAPEIKVEELTPEQLASNPFFAKLNADMEELNKKFADIDATNKQKEDEDLKKKGEWEKIASQHEATIADLNKKLADKDDIIGKYKGTTKAIVDNALKNIPDDKKKLIPDKFSDREKLEYITANADFLGVSVAVGSGTGVPPNKGTPPANEEERLVNEYNELMAKGATRTLSETTKFIELGRKIKEIRNKK